MRSKQEITESLVSDYVEKNKPKLVNFRLLPEEYDGLRILAELTDRTQADIVRDLIKAEITKQATAIQAYKESLAKAKNKIIK